MIEIHDGKGGWKTAFILSINLMPAMSATKLIVPSVLCSHAYYINHTSMPVLVTTIVLCMQHLASHGIVHMHVHAYRNRCMLDIIFQL